MIYLTIYTKYLAFREIVTLLALLFNRLALPVKKRSCKMLEKRLPACRRLLFPLLHAEKGRLRNAVANRVPASRWQGILFRINCEIISC